MNKYKSNSKEEKNQLKKDLMNPYNSSSLSNNSTNVTETITKSNVREILKEKLGSKVNDIERNIKYREIRFGEIVKIVSLNFPQSITFNSEYLLFIMKEDDSLLISVK